MSMKLRLRALIALPVALALAFGLMVATATASEASSAKSERRADKVQKMLKVAKKQRGDQYRRGGTGPNGFDCSGLIQYSAKKAGIKVPRTSDSQADALRPVSKRKMKRGDLVYFDKGGDVYHAGIYLGKKKGEKIMLDASRPGEPVTVHRIWTSDYTAKTLRLS